MTLPLPTNDDLADHELPIETLEEIAGGWKFPFPPPPPQLPPQGE